MSTDNSKISDSVYDLLLAEIEADNDNLLLAQSENDLSQALGDLYDEEGLSNGPMSSQEPSVSSEPPVSAIYNLEPPVLTEEDYEEMKTEAAFGDEAWLIDKNLRISTFNKQALREGFIKSRKIQQEKRRVIKTDKIQIQRDAFNQDKIPIYSEVGLNNLRLLVSLLTKEYSDMIYKYEKYINKRLGDLLGVLMPKRLRACYKIYPESFRRMPGFLYQTSSKHGGGLTFWVRPDLPYFFKQGTEQQLLFANKAPDLISVDHAIYLYYRYIDKRADKEIKCASKILQKNIKTYYDLLKLNPFWYKKLFDELTKVQDGQAPID